MNLQRIIIETLKKEVVPAIGCTEPVAVSLACAKARELVGGGCLIGLNVFVSPNIFKNGFAVGVPPTDEVGLFMAAALGYVAGKSEKDLQLLEGIGPRDIEDAKQILSSGKLSLEIKDTKEKVYIEVKLCTSRGDAKVIIKGKHNRYAYMESRGKVLHNNQSCNIVEFDTENILYNMKISDLIKTIQEIPHEDIAFMLDGLEMNLKVAMEGISKKLGMGVGYCIYKNMKKKLIAEDFINTAMMLTAAASDARMAGISMPVMSSNGSGNNGLTAILPIAAYKTKFEVTEEKLAKALAISHILNSYIKHYIGRLSALCGCGVAAGTGAGVAIAWLMGANDKQLAGVIKNILGNISGMVCDGAKVGCALKLAASASSAIQSAFLAIDDHIIPAGNGIIAETAEDTIKNLKVLSDEGMKLTDEAILKVMQDIHKRASIVR